MTAWPEFSLRELTTSTRPIAYGVLKPGPHDPNGVPLLRIQDMAKNVISKDRLHYITPNLDAEFSRSKLSGGEVLLSIQGTIGRAAVVPDDLAGANVSRTLAIIAPDARVDPRYLRFYFLMLEARGAYQTAGSTRASLNIGTIREMKVPVPPLEQQRKIVEMLEDYLSRLNAGIDYLDAGAKRLKRLKESLIDGLVWDAGYPVRKVRDLLREKMRNGHSAPAVTDGSDGIRTLTLTAVTLDKFEDRYTKITTASPKKVRDMWLEPGDVFVQRSNTPELVGTTRLYEGPSNWAIFPDLLIRLRASGEVFPPYLALALNSERAQRSLRARAKGLAGSMPKIDQGTIGDTEIPVPSSVDEQRQVVRIVNARQAELNRVGEALDGAKLRASSLRRSLLSAAFSGRLTGATSDIERVKKVAADIMETGSPKGVLV